MEAKEPIGTYNAMPSTPIMRGRLIKALENEEDSDFIHKMYMMMTTLKKESVRPNLPKYTLASLEGIIASDNVKSSYDDLRKVYLKEKYLL